MLEYRNIKFIFHDWRTWNNKRGSGYKCSDESLLRHVNTRSFGTKRLLEMHDQIDYYLDNAELHKKQRQLTEAGITAYYADKRANGNNYTGD